MVALLDLVCKPFRVWCREGAVEGGCRNWVTPEAISPPHQEQGADREEISLRSRMAEALSRI